MAYRKSVNKAPTKVKAPVFSKKTIKATISVKKRPKSAPVQVSSDGMNSLLNTVNDILSAAKPFIINWLHSYVDKGQQSDKRMGDEDAEKMSKEEISKIGRKVADEMSNDTEMK